MHILCQTLNMQRSAPLPRSRQLEKTIPPVLRPIIRAYVLGYASSTVPRLLTLFLTHLSRRRKNIDEKPQDFFPLSFIRILKGGLEIQRFPTFCAALVCYVSAFLLEAGRGSISKHVSGLRLNSIDDPQTYPACFRI